jgi:hypothetical protein
MASEILKQNSRPAGSPKREFAFPLEVVDDPSFSFGEKRAILCEWASDRCAVESFPTLRWLQGTTFPVTFSAVMDALAHLDRIAERRAAHERLYDLKPFMQRRFTRKERREQIVSSAHPDG